MRPGLWRIQFSSPFSNNFLFINLEVFYSRMFLHRTQKTLKFPNSVACQKAVPGRLLLSTCQFFVFWLKVFATNCCWIQDSVDLCSALALQALYLWASFCCSERLGWDFKSSCEVGGEGRGQ